MADLAGAIALANSAQAGIGNGSMLTLRDWVAHVQMGVHNDLATLYAKAAYYAANGSAPPPDSGG